MSFISSRIGIPNLNLHVSQDHYICNPNVLGKSYQYHRHIFKKHSRTLVRSLVSPVSASHWKCKDYYTLPHFVFSFIGNANWDWYVEYKGASWAYFIHTWLSQNNTEILIVQYEKLVSNLEDELVRIMNFLNLIPQESYLECALREREGIYKRSTHLNFDPYSRENLDNINRYIEPALKLLLNYNISYSLR